MGTSQSAGKDADASSIAVKQDNEATSRRAMSSRRARVDAEGNEVVKVGCYSRFMAKHACVVAILSFLAIIIISFAALFEGMPPLVNTGWRDSTSVIRKRVRAHGEVVADAYDAPSAADADAASNVTRVREADLDYVSVLYDAFQGGSMLSAAAIAKVIEFEGTVRGASQYELYCKLVYADVDDGATEPDPVCASPTTILNYLHVDNSKHEEECEAGFCYMPRASLAACGVLYDWGSGPCRSKIYDWRDAPLVDEDERSATLSDVCNETALRRVILPVEHNCGRLEARYLRSYYPVVGGPIAGQTDFQVLKEDDQIAVVKAAWGESLKQVIMNKHESLSVTPTMARTAATAASNGKIMDIYWYSEVGEWVTAAAYLDMALAAFSMIFVFLYLWFNTQSIVLALAGIFEIFMSVPLALFIWKIVLGQQFIDWLMLVSVYVVVCVGADDIFVFVDTWKLSKTMAPAISGTLETRFAWTFHRAAGTMLVTTTTTAVCLGFTAFSSIPAIRAFGIFAALQIIVDYLQVITWFASIVYLKARMCEECCAQGCCGPCAGDVTPAGEMPKERWITRWLHGSFTPFLYKWRYLLVVLSIAIAGGAGAVVATRLKFTEGLTFLKRDHPFQKFIDTQSDEFYSVQDWKYDITLIYGVDKDAPINYELSNQLFPETQAGWDMTIQYTPNYDFSPSVQEAIVADCEAAKARAEVPNNEVWCLMNELKSHAPDAFPYASEAALRTALDDYVSSSSFTDLRADMQPMGFGTRESWYVPDGDDGIKAFWHTFNSTIPSTVGGSLTRTTPHYNDWLAFTESRCGSTGCFHAASRNLYGFWDLMFSLFSYSLSAMYLTIIATFVVLLLATFNIAVALLATLTICLALLCTVGLLAGIGTTFGLWEFIFTILAVGMSIDYAVHLSHFYNEAGGTRYDKARNAVHGVGVSVVGGAVTTMGAGLPLFFCVFDFFRSEGIFIFCTSASALVLSFIFLVPLLMIMGPEGNQADLLVCCKKEPEASK